MDHIFTTEAARQQTDHTQEIAVLGGTGFIGTVLVKQLVEAGFMVSVMARHVTDVPPIFKNNAVRLIQGDICNTSDVRRIIKGVTHVVNLAHGGGNGSWGQVRERMVSGAETIGRACLQEGATLIHISSIAALDMGKRGATITGASPVNAHEGRRPYARGKAMAEEYLLDVHRIAGLRLCILRPGIVVGVDTSPLHPGIGTWNNNRDCIGWNRGFNPLPFVLVDDVADAIVRACASEASIGKTYNLVGDVRPSAREYLEELSRVTDQRFVFHPRYPEAVYAGRLLRWTIKRLMGRNAASPSWNDIVSRGLHAEFDCSDVKNDLRWKPVSDTATFYRKAFESASEF